ncbi:hypothetical protein [Stenotrophomonas sp.]|uniref:hypothetical protein n=1 Tax=Stenotrophomonas sp. TaxID=69392 RepID=UPI002FCB6AB3
MRALRIRVVWALLLLACGAWLSTVAAARTAPVPGSLHARLVALDATPAQPPAERLAAMRIAYAQAAPVTMQPAACTALPDDRLQDLFRSTALIAFYAREPATLLRLQCLYEALVARDLAADEHHRAMRGSLIALQRFDEANALNDRLQTPPAALPQIQGNTLVGRPLLRMMGLAQVERTVLAEAGVVVVAVVHPYCGFSRRALEAITTRPDYAWLRSHLQLVVPIGQAWPGQEMLDWNTAHPALPMQPMVSDPSWQVLDTGQSPVFHLLRDGKVVATVSGWPPEGADLRLFRAALEAEQR